MDGREEEGRGRVACGQCSEICDSVTTSVRGEKEKHDRHDTMIEHATDDSKYSKQ